MNSLGWSRRGFVVSCGVACAGWPVWLGAETGAPAEAAIDAAIRAVVRPPTLFAGIREAISARAELAPRVLELEKACGDHIAGPLTHIFRFDTQVEGYDSEIGFPVRAPVDAGRVKTHQLREMHFYSTRHQGPPETIHESTGALYEYMKRTGLSPELELVEVYHGHRPEAPFGDSTEVMASFLAWPEVYRTQLERVLGAAVAAVVWQGGEAIDPHTPVDPRAAWVGQSLERLKARTTPDQQYDILSRVALVRPAEDVEAFRGIYETTGSVDAVVQAQREKLEKGRTGGFVDPPRCDGKILHMSKVPYNGAAYRQATSQTERRRAYCFCNLVREAADPKIDPIFCYRAAGWARQFWEPILGVQLNRCTITHSILKGDGFCAWDWALDPPPDSGSDSGQTSS